MGLFERLLHLVRRRQPRVEQPDRLAEHEDGLRLMVADAAGEPYRAWPTLAEARRNRDAVAILQGDDGGQLYVVARVREIRCDEEVLKQLLTDLDRLEWNDPSAATLRFEHHAVGSGIGGGMGGAVATEGVWIHEELRALHLEEPIEQVITGEVRRLPQKYRQDGQRRLP